MDEESNGRTLNYELVAEEGGIQIFEVSLSGSGLPQGYRARKVIDISRDTGAVYGGTIREQRTIEVVINGDGMSKAKRKLEYAELLAKEDRSKLGIIGTEGRRHPERSDRLKARSAKRSSWAPSYAPTTPSPSRWSSW